MRSSFILSSLPVRRLAIAGLFAFLAFTPLQPCAAPAAPAKENIATPADSIILHKAFYMLAAMSEPSALRNLIENNAVLSKITAEHAQRLEDALDKCIDGRCYAAALQWRTDETDSITNELVRLNHTSGLFKRFTRRLKSSPYYALYEKLPDTAFLGEIWRSAASGINYMLGVYLAGEAPLYPAIDAMDTDPSDEKFTGRVREALKTLLNDSQKQEGLFFTLPIEAALKAMALNGRDEAARYEPLLHEYNAESFLYRKKIAWRSYPYSSILVLGQGPEDPAVALSLPGASNCVLAAEEYRKGLAPFIIVSGGHVHPNKTKYCEAVEMKKYLVEELHIPAKAIIIEPHARHTTTNLRNATRLIYEFGMPAKKPVLVVTTTPHSEYVLKMDKRCMKELGYLPYRDLHKINDRENAFYPVRESFQANPLDPLDP